MSEQNIIPSAPQLYPERPSNGMQFRWKKNCDCQKQLEDEMSHYKKFSQKYNRAKSVTSKIATLTELLTTVLTSSSLATSLSGIGIAVGVPLSCVALVMTIFSSTALVGIGRFDKK